MVRAVHTFPADYCSRVLEGRMRTRIREATSNALG